MLILEIFLTSYFFIIQLNISNINFLLWPIFFLKINYIVVGCTGFNVSNTVDRLLSMRHLIIGIDKLSIGQILFLASALKSNFFLFLR
jgi:hypothetical protein